jgi:hypothetical protein
MTIALLILICVFVALAFLGVSLLGVDGLLWALVETVQLVAAVVGWVVLIVPCLRKSWHDTPSPFNPARTVDAWNSRGLQAIFGNPEDGVSGQHALIWLNGTTQGEYMPGADPRWRAYCWNARNSADQLKYWFAWRWGPLVLWEYKLFGKVRTLRVGWQDENGFNVPVFGF